MGVDGRAMTICRLVPGSGITLRRVGDVSVSELRLNGIEQLHITDHSICFYPIDEAYSVERWEGKTQPRKHWAVGSVGFIPAGSELSSHPEKPYREKWVRFHAGLFTRSAAGLIHTDQLDYRFQDITDAAVFSFARAVSSLSLMPDIEQWPMLIEAASLALSVSIIKKMAKPGVLATVDEQHQLCDVRIRRVTEYVEANLSRRISLQDLANIAALSQYHFSRQFTLKVGISPLRYVMARRVEMAKRELVRPRANLAEVAYACGFGGQSHFTTTFRTLVGVTPGEYRRGHGFPA